METDKSPIFDTPDRCYCSSNAECAYCLRQIELATGFTTVCETEGCGKVSDSDTHCDDCIDGMVNQWERQIERERGL